MLKADRWFARSKTCSQCGTKAEKLPLSVRKWTCIACGSLHDRDINAAINLKNIAVSSTVLACGAEGSGSYRKMRTKPATLKQEFNSKPTRAKISSGMNRFERTVALG